MSIKSILDDACTDLWLPSKDHLTPLPNYYAPARTATVQGMAGYGDHCLNLDGDDDGVSCGQAGLYEVDHAFSFLCWLQADVLIGTRIVAWDTDANDALGWQFYLAGGWSIFALKSSEGGSAYADGSEASGGLDLIVGTYDGSILKAGIKIYRNGSLDVGGTAGTIGGTMLHDDPLLWGRGTYGSRLTGSTRALGLFDRELTLAEAQTLYDSGNGWQGLEAAVAGGGATILAQQAIFLAV